MSWCIILSIIFLGIQPSICDIIEESCICSNRQIQFHSDVASSIISAMDATVDPCQDFYKFACGRWVLNNPRPKFLRSKWNNLAQLSFLAHSRVKDQLMSMSRTSQNPAYAMVKKFFDSCMDEGSERDAVAKILRILEETDGWPMIMKSNQWNPNGRTWQSLDEYYSTLVGHSAFYSIDLIRGKDAGLFSLKIQDRLTWPEIFKQRSIYQNLITKVSETFIREIDTNVPSQQLTRDIEDLINFEYKLYVASQGKKKEEIVVDQTKFIQDFNSQTQSYPNTRITWENVFQRLFTITNLRPSVTNQVIIKPLEYFVELAKILQSTDKRTIINYIHWKFFTNMLPDAIKKMENYYNKIKYDVDYSNELPRWMHCVNNVGRNYVTYSLFIEKYYPEWSREKANNLYRELLESWIKQVDDSNWLSRKAQNSAKAKIRSLSAVLGYSNFYRKDSNIIEYFNGLEMTDSYFTNKFRYSYFMWKKEIMLWGKTIGSRESLDDPLSLNAHLDRQRNIYFVTPTFLQSPLLDEKLPNYVTYSTVGAVMAHEMSHVLDYNTFKTLLPSRNEDRSYDTNVRCFINSYAKYFTEAAIERAEFTRNENIADWNGLLLAFQAYKKKKSSKFPNGDRTLPGLGGYTDEQMFFISFAQTWCSANNEDNPTDPHAPNYLRINGVVSNIPEFSKAFNCPMNTPMNPANKCNVWKS